MKSKLTSPAGKEAVKDLEDKPEEGDNRKAAEAALSKFLRSDANALADLAKLLEQAGSISAAQTANVVGGNRNASHPANAIFNYAYTVLQSKIQISAISEGYDPTIGIMHERNDGSAASPSLTDLARMPSLRAMNSS